MKQTTQTLKTYQYFWQLIKFRPKEYAKDLTGATIHFALSSVLGLILKAYFDGLTGAGGLPVWQVVGVQLIHLALVLISLYVAVMAYVNFTQHGMALLIRNMFSHILKMPGAKALPKNQDGSTMTTGQVVSTLRDDVDEMAFSIIIIDDTVALSVTALISFTIMFRINAWVTLGTFAPLAIIIVIAQMLGGRAKTYRKASREATSNVTGMIADMFNATQAVKVGHAEERIISRFRTLNDRRRETMVKDRFLSQLIDTLSGSTVDVGVGFILLVAAQAMYEGAFSVGDFALFASYIWPSTHMMRTIGNFMTRYKQVGISTGRMEAIMQGEPAGAVVAHHPIYMTDNLPAIPHPTKTNEDKLHTISVKNLSYLYPNEHQETGSGGVEDINFTIQRGSFTVITGRIGSGKTTLLKLLLGLLPPQSGEILWNGKLVTHPTTFFVPPRVAYTAQVPRLFSDSLRNNILLGLSEENVDIVGALETAVMTPDLRSMEDGLDTMVGPRGIRLSGGQVQRTAAARMFARNAELLVFDDLSSALDVETEQQLWENLSERQKTEGRRQNETTALVVSHRRPALRRADHIIVLQNGRLLDQGSLDELLERCEEMKRLWQGQV